MIVEIKIQWQPENYLDTGEPPLFKRYRDAFIGQGVVEIEDARYHITGLEMSEPATGGLCGRFALVEVR